MKKGSLRGSLKFAIIVAVLAFPISGVFDTSTIFLNRTAWYVGAFVVLFIVLIGVIFDMLGLAAAAARETPFHAMASKRVFGAKRSIVIVRNAEKVSSICSDVIGDVAGVLSGATSLAVASQLSSALHLEGWDREWIIISLTALTTAITVGAKAVGKTVAIQNPTPIVLAAARILDSLLALLRRQSKSVRGGDAQH